MSHIIRLRVGELEYEAQLNESETAQAIYDALPIECIGSRWGDEYYSRIDVQMTEADDARSEMAVGELAYWPPGTAFCIFFWATTRLVRQRTTCGQPGESHRAYQRGLLGIERAGSQRTDRDRGDVSPTGDG